jgi:hypothetical protein
MDPKLVMYVGYLAVSLVLTAWVARTLFRNGQVFLDDALGDERLARSVNHLLVVGFWLLNAGYVAVAIRVSGEVRDAAQALETLSVKLGLVLLVLGGVHMFNVYVLSRFRRRRMLDAVPPPLPPAAYLPRPHTPHPHAPRGAERPAGPEWLPPPAA